MSLLSVTELENFRGLLEQRRMEILEVMQIGEQSAGTVELDQARIGRLSRMDAIQTQAMSVEIKRRRELQLQQIKTACQRLEKGDYGICVSCEEAISIERLQFDPATPVCIHCAHSSENK